MKSVSPPPLRGTAVSRAVRRHPFVAAVDRNLRLRCGVAAGTAAGPLVVGTSGGADSVALLIACAALRDRAREAGRVHPIAVHVHHHLRDDSADADAEFVARLCDALDVEFHIDHVRPGEHTGNTAATARDLRYEAFTDAAGRLGAARVAVAHHGDDQLETMLIALCRGAGLDGLGGMAWSRPLGGDVTLVRPLLDLERSDTEAFCRAAGVAWRDDPGNVDPARLRARLRTDVMQALRDTWPGAGRRVAGVADAIRESRAALDGLLADAFGPPTQRTWPRAALAALAASHPTLAAAGLRRAALHAAPGASDALGQRHLRGATDAICAADTHPRGFDWPAGLRLEVRAHEVCLTTRINDRPGAPRR